MDYTIYNNFLWSLLDEDSKEFINELLTSNKVKGDVKVIVKVKDDKSTCLNISSDEFNLDLEIDMINFLNK